MKKVIIVSKTHMMRNACVGALTFDDSRSIRLLQEDGHPQPADTAFEVGQIWQIAFEPFDEDDLEPPHIEDVCVLEQKYHAKQTRLKETLLNRVKPWEGSAEVLFDECLRFPRNGGNAYISEHGEIPSCSTGFWLPDAPLKLEQDERGKLRYHYDNHDIHIAIPYVGFADPIGKISTGTLVRMSLARWWRPNDPFYTGEERCYLQVSGWYR